MADGIFSKLGWIGIGALISSPISALVEPFFSELYKSVGDSVTSVVTQMNTPLAIQIATFLPLILGGIGGILIAWDLVHRRRKRSGVPIMVPIKPDVILTENLPADPNLQFGRLCVKKRADDMHGGRYDRSFYYIEIVNTVPSTVASNCQGSITLDSNTYSTIWEKNRSYTIPVAHKELLYLFETSVFTNGSNQVTRLYLKWGIHTVDNKAIHDYNNNIDKLMTVLIQSGNAKFPSEADSLKKTIRQIIHESIEC